MQIVFIITNGQKVDFTSLTGLTHPDIKNRQEALYWIAPAMEVDERIIGFELRE
jgi:hypothetical protein